MIKFGLIICVCSFLGAQPSCMPAMEFPKQFDSWYECTRGAHKEAQLLISEMGYQYVNQYKIAMSYSCKEITSY